MRPLRWDAFQAAARSRGAERAVSRVAHRAPDFALPQGHILEIVRVRRGQRQFREHLLGAQGETCAFTGEAPARVLEAGHLYSYAELGVHHEHGGHVELAVTLRRRATASDTRPHAGFGQGGPSHRALKPSLWSYLIR